MSKHVQHTDLLTEKQKIDYIQRNLLPKSKHSELFDPSDKYFHPDSSLAKLAQDVLIALMPSVKKITIKTHSKKTENSTLVIEQRTDAIHLCVDPLLYTLPPIIAASHIILSVCSHVVDSKIPQAKIDAITRQALIELLTIYAGFGIFIVNAITYQGKLLQKKSMQNILVHYPSHSYIDKFIEYTHAEDIRIDNHFCCFTQPAQKQLTKRGILKNPATKQAPRAFIVNDSRENRLYMTKVIGILLFILIWLGIVIFVSQYVPRNKPDPTAEQLQKMQSLQQLRVDYNSCIQTLRELESKTYQKDTLGDASINAQKNACSSIKNEYNHLLKTDEK
jgi:hypothetical protein